MTQPLQTQVLAVDPLSPEPASMALAANHIRAGRLVAFPTETVYGLGANALDAQAVARIFAAKGRPASDPLIVHIAALRQLEAVALDLPAVALRLAQRFWPGPLTLVLPRHPNVPPSVSAGLGSVAVRMPDHPVALALIEAAGVPIAAPSANRFTRPSPTTAQHVLDDLRGQVDVVLDGGPTRIGIESTVLSLVGTPTVLRPGGVPIEDLRALLPELVYAPRYLEEAGAAAPGPGMLLKHYAPNAEVLLFRGPRELVLARMRAIALERGGQTGVLAPSEELAAFEGLGAQVVSLGSRENLAEVGARLFAGMRALEHAGVTAILVRGFEHEGLGLAIWDRLLRSTEGRVIVVGEDTATDTSFE